ncbi:folate-binding protein YgfZ [Denitratisoma sp. agr-D3]
MTQQNSPWSALIGTDSLAHIGDPAAEVQAVASATVVAPLDDFAVIRASGEEALSFLHNLLTNDVNGLAADGLRKAGFCTPKGRLLADFRLWREGDDVLLSLSADIHAVILKKLSMYVLRAKVKLSDASADRLLLGIAGPEAGALVADLAGTAPATGTTAAFPQGSVLAWDERRYWLSLHADAALDLWRRLSSRATPVGTQAWRAVDIAAGEPRILAATQEEFIPQMINFAQVGGLSFKKGCYPGQEIVARTQYLGKIKRHMYRATVASQEASPGTPVYAPETGEQACGNIVLSAPTQGGNEVLAVIQTSCAEAGQLTLGRPDGPALSLLPLPYAVE